MISKNHLVEKLRKRGLDLGRNPDATLRYYRHLGLIDRSTIRSEGPGYVEAFYPEHTLEKLCQIKELQKMGCSLKDIREICLIEQGKKVLATTPNKDGRVTVELSRSGKNGLLNEGLIKAVEQTRRVFRESEKEWKHHLGIGRGLDIAKELMLLALGIRDRNLEVTGIAPVRDKAGQLKGLSLKLRSFKGNAMKEPKNSRKKKSQ